MHEDVKKESSFTGYGLGSFRYRFHTEHKSDWLRAHNDPLQVYYELGILGLLALIAVWLSFFIDINDKWIFTSFMIFSVGCGGFFLCQIGWHSFLMALLLSIDKGCNEQYR